MQMKKKSDNNVILLIYLIYYSDVWEENEYRWVIANFIDRFKPPFVSEFEPHYFECSLGFIKDKEENFFAKELGS
jgi:hypothetical protein